MAAVEMELMFESAQIDAKVITLVFNKLFRDTLSTELVCAQSVFGDNDPRSTIPIYTTSPDPLTTHKVYFANGFASSALHEISHWCIASAKRRSLDDYGYWYYPGERDIDQQADFERFEARNQGLEWILASACNMQFYASFDNIERATSDQLVNFRQSILNHACDYLAQGLPPRAALVKNAFLKEFKTESLFTEYWSQIKVHHQLPLF